MRISDWIADVCSSALWAAPVVAEDFDDHLDRGPVLVTIRYRIDVADSDQFLKAIYELSDERYRDGAYNWGVSQDSAEPRVWIEWFFVSSWAEHLRQHERATGHDQDVHDSVRAYHRGGIPPEVRHYLAPPHNAARHLTKPDTERSEEHTSELQSLLRTSYAVFRLKKKKTNKN